MAAHLTNKDQHTIERYLARHAEPDVANITTHTPNKTYQNCVVIPAYNESIDFIHRLQTDHPLDSPLLIVVVINQPDNTGNSQANQQLWDQITQSNTCTHRSSSHQWLSTPNGNVDILLIDRFTRKIPKKQGVGLARKIGGDVACQLISTKQLSNPWVYHTDADTHLPNNYFTAIRSITSKEQQNASAAVFAYEHIATNEDSRFVATQHYEQALSYYVNGLKKAGSPYAYHTLGSCIVTHAVYYCQAHGFPKKAGGEDFYLLNKLAKLGNILNIPNTTLKIDARFSDRVPFGTGPAVEKILAMAEPDKEYLYYHPSCFDELTSLLNHFEQLFRYRCEHTKETQSLTRERYSLWTKQLSLPLQHALQTLGIQALFLHIDKQTSSQQQCLKHCHQWLDAFKTLKLIHLLEKDYPKQALSQSLQ